MRILYCIIVSYIILYYIILYYIILYCIISYYIILNYIILYYIILYYIILHYMILHYIILYYIILYYIVLYFMQYVTQNIKRRKNARNAGNYSDSSSFPETQNTVVLEFARLLSVFLCFLSSRKKNNRYVRHPQKNMNRERTLETCGGEDRDVTTPPQPPPRPSNPNPEKNTSTSGTHKRT